VRGTYTRNNLDFAEDVKWLVEEEGFTQVSVEPVVLPANSPYSILEEHIPVICKEYERLARYYKKSRKGGKWFNFFHFMMDLGNGPCALKRLKGCGAGTEYVAITPNGDIYPCHQFAGETQWRMGNVFTGLEAKQISEKFRCNHALNKEKCSRCWAMFYCSGGCAANAWHNNQDISKPYDIECQLERKRVECAIWANMPSED